jgi:dienelactone hydrolase
MKFSFIILSFFIGFQAMAAIEKKNVEYSADDSQKMEGFVAYETTGAARKPAVLIVHDWMGLGDFQKAKAEQLAKMGFVAFAADEYGQGIRPKDAKEAGEISSRYKSGDRKMMRSHVVAAYNQLKSMKNVDPKKIVVIGYCFGGNVALELARSGVPLAGTATFHGGLSSANPADAKNIKSPVLIMHGADDPFVGPAEVEAFKKEMQKAKAPFTFIPYKGAVHAFTNPDAGSDNSKGAAYNAKADQKSWKDFTSFLQKVTE